MNSVLGLVKVNSPHFKVAWNLTNCVDWISGKRVFIIYGFFGVFFWGGGGEVKSWGKVWCLFLGGHQSLRSN
jgi:hypothetical protein